MRPPTSTPYLAQLSLDRQKWSLAESAHREGQTGAPRSVTQEHGGPGPAALRRKQAAVPAALTTAALLCHFLPMRLALSSAALSGASSLGHTPGACPRGPEET